MQEALWKMDHPCFFIFFAQAMPATIFGFSVGFFAFVGLTVQSLCLAAILSFPG